MKIKLICSDCGTPFSCEKGKELDAKTRCPNCNSGNITIPMQINECGCSDFIEETQETLS